MSRTIDEKVVEMRFDNSNFEKNTKTTLSTLEKLKAALKLDGAAKGLNDVERAAKGIDLSSLASSVKKLEDHFSVFGIISDTAIRKVTSAMMDLSAKTMTFLTSGIVQGGLKRAMNLEQAHFQLQGLLKDEEAVNAVMQNVNDSVDGTAYSLDSAAKAASMFAATGMRAGDQMYKSLRAVAGVAAMTGAQYEDISMIFTTVAGQGRVMADQYNQLASRGLNAAATIAEYLTKIQGGVKVTEQEVREMTSDGKISFEIFAAAMDDAFGEHAKKANETFTGAMSNIKSALARIGADFVSPLIVQNGALVKLFNTIRVRINEIRKQTTPFAVEVTDAITSIVERLTVMAGAFDLSGAFTLFGNGIETIKNLASGLMTVLDPIKLAFKDIFPYDFGDLVLGISEKLKKISESAKLNLDQMVKLRDIAGGVFSAFDLIGRAFDALYRFSEPLRGALSDIFNWFLSIAAGIGKYITKLDDAVAKNDVFYNVLITISGALQKAANSIKEFIKAVQTKFNIPSFKKIAEDAKALFNSLKERIAAPGLEALSLLVDRLKIRFGQLKDACISFKDAAATAFNRLSYTLQSIGIDDLFRALWDSVKNISGGIIESVGIFVDLIIDKLGKADFSGIIDLLNSLTAGGIGIGLYKYLDKVTSTVDKFSGIGSSIKGVLGSVKDTLKSFQEEIKSNILLKIATAVGIMAAALVALSMIDSEKLNSALGGMTVMMADLAGVTALLGKLGKDVEGAGGISTELIAVSLSIVILAKAMKNLSELNWEGIGKGLTGITVMMGELIGVLKLLDSVDGNSAMSKSLSLIGIGAALKILASVAKDLSGLSWDELAKSLVGIGSFLGELQLFLNAPKVGNFSMSTALGIVALGAGLKILANVANDFASMSWESIGKGLAAIGGFLAEISGFNIVASVSKNLLTSSFALIEVAEAMKNVIPVFQQLGSMSWESISKGLVGMGGALAEFSLALVAIANFDAEGASAAIIVTAASFRILIPVFQQLGSMSWESISKGLVGMGGALAEFAIGLNYMKGTASAAGALMLAATAILILTPALMGLGSMGLVSIVASLGTLAGVFVILGAAAKILEPLVPVILSLSAALALIGVGMAAFGAGTILLGAGFASIAAGMAALATAGATYSTMFVASLSAIVLGVADLIPQVATKFAEGLIKFGEVIGDAAPKLGEAFKKLVLSMIDVWKECIPALAEGLLQTVDKVLESLVQYGPGIIDKLLTFVISVLDGLVAHMPELVEKVMQVITTFFSSIIDALSGMDVNVLINSLEGLGLVSALMIAFAALSNLAAPAMVGVLAVGAVIAELALVLAAIGGLAQIPGLNWLVNEGGVLLEGIGTAIGKFIGGIVGGVVSGFTSQLPDIGSDLSDFMDNVQPFINGAKSIDASVLESVGILSATIIALSGAEIVSGIANFVNLIGGNKSFSQFSESLTSFGNAMVDFSAIISGNIDPEAISAAANAGRLLTDLNNSLPPSGGVLQTFLGEKSFDKFSASLVPFGEAMSEFSASISGKIDSAAVTSAVNAGKLLAELNNSLPPSGGVLQTFLGEKSFDKFSASLVPFGEAMSEFSASISGKIDSAAVDACVNAGMALSGLQESLPETDGVIQSWFGTQMNLETFGSQILSFGENMAEYSKSVSGKIDEDAVSASARMGTLLSELNSSLPETGGVVQWFFGEKSLDSFGEALITFGEGMADYAESVSDLDVGVVAKSAAIAQALVALQNALPESGGWWGAIAGGEKSLGDFGKDLSTFGSYFLTFYGYIVDINPMTITLIIASLQSLITFLSSMESINSESVDGFKTALTSLAETSFDDFLNVFQGSTDRIVAAVDSMLSNFASALSTKSDVLSSPFSDMIDAVIIVIESKSGEFTSAGNNLAIEFGGGITAQAFNATNAMEVILTDILTKIGSKYPLIKENATVLMNNFDSGISSKQSTIVASMEKILSDILKKISSKKSEFTSGSKALLDAFNTGITQNQMTTITKVSQLMDQLVKTITDSKEKFSSAAKVLMEGLQSGITNNAGGAKSAAQHAASSAAEGAKGGYNAFYNAGYHLVLGLANGITQNAYLARAKAYAMADSAARAAKNALKEHSPSKVGEEIGYYFDVGMVNGMEKGLTQVQVAGERVAREVEESFNDASDAANGAGKDVADGFNDGLDGVEAAGDKISSAVTGENTDRYYIAGVEAIEKFVKGMEDAFNTTLEDAERIPKLLADAIKKTIAMELPSSFGEESGAQIIDSFIKGFEAGMKNLDAYMTTFNEVVVKPEYLKSYNEAGQKMGVALESGIYVALKNIEDAMENIATAILSSTKKTIEREMPKAFGVMSGQNVLKFFMTGFIEGMTEFNEYLEEFSEKILNVIDTDGFRASGEDAARAFFRGFEELSNANISNTVSNIGIALNEIPDQLVKVVEEVMTKTLPQGIGEETGKIVADNIIKGFQNGIGDYFKKYLIDFGSSISTEDATKNFTYSGKRAGTAFMKGFSDLEPKLKEKAEKLPRVFGTAVQTILTEIIPEKMGADTAEAVIKSFVEGFELINEDLATALEELRKLLMDSLEALELDGSTFVKRWLSGMITGIRAYQTAFYGCGKFLVEGLAAGISENAYLAEARSREMARRAIDAARAEFDEHSPSKVGYQIGFFFPKGVANGIGAGILLVADESERLATVATETLTDAFASIAEGIEDDINLDPTITPILDLSEVRKNIGQIDTMMASENAKSISANYTRKFTKVSDDGNQNESPKVVNNNFTQNNYSPKSLSRVEIYRDTKNLFSQMKESVKT